MLILKIVRLYAIMQQYCLRHSPYCVIAGLMFASYKTADRSTLMFNVESLETRLWLGY